MFAWRWGRRKEGKEVAMGTVFIRRRTVMITLEYTVMNERYIFDTTPDNQGREGGGRAGTSKRAHHHHCKLKVNK
jgi:hypothetical protein